MNGHLDYHTWWRAGLQGMGNRGQSERFWVLSIQYRPMG